MEGFREFFNRPAYTEQEVVDLYLLHGKKISEISGLTGLTAGSLYRLLRDQQVRPNRQKQNHENVRMFAASGLKAHQIADLTGYTPRNVRYILGKNG